MPGTRKLLPLALCALLVLASCDDSSGDAETSSSNPDIQSPAVSALTSTPIDWSIVPVLSGHEDVGELMRLIRHVNSWHSTTKKSINLRFKAPGEAVDEFGHSLSMTPTQWKSIVTMVDTTRSKNKAATGREIPFLMKTPPAMGQDRLGELPDIAYEVLVDDPEHIRLVCLGERNR